MTAKTACKVRHRLTVDFQETHGELSAMLVVCPICGASNTVVADYKAGSILACGCGELLEFVSSEEPPRVVRKKGSIPPASGEVQKGPKFEAG